MILGMISLGVLGLAILAGGAILWMSQMPTDIDRTSHRDDY